MKRSAKKKAVRKIRFPCRRAGNHHGPTSQEKKRLVRDAGPGTKHEKGCIQVPSRDPDRPGRYDDRHKRGSVTRDGSRSGVLLFTAEKTFIIVSLILRPDGSRITRSYHALGRDRDTNSGAYARVLSSALPIQVDLQVAESRTHAQPAVHPSRDLVYPPKRCVSALPFIHERR